MILVTGGAGFIGSHFIVDWFERCNEFIVNIDLLTYAGNPGNLNAVNGNPNYKFIEGDIRDSKLVSKVIANFEPRAIAHFAAETHVDQSITSPERFVSTNVVGTTVLLECARQYWIMLDGGAKREFRFLHISTDEVFGSLAPNESKSTELSPYAPNNPYAASKAASDHLVRAYFKTFNFPTLTSNCSNNYGPFQLEDKLVPLVILNAITRRPIPIFGDGQNIRDWIFVRDHCKALQKILHNGKPGASYNVGANNEITNLVLVNKICEILDDLYPRKDDQKYAHQIDHVMDRPGHDFRYAVDATKLRTELGWRPLENFELGLKKTIRWYLENLSPIQEQLTSRSRFGDEAS